MRGAVRVAIEFDDPRLFESGREVLLNRGGESRETRIEELKFQHGRWVLELAGIESIGEAERWIGGRISIREEELPEPEEGSYYDFDLEGCEVVDAGGQRLGTVLEVVDYGGTVLLRIERGQGEALIPFARQYMRKIDTVGRRIEVELPEGLLDLDTR